MESLQQLARDMGRLAVLRPLLKSKVMRRFRAFAAAGPGQQAETRYCAFVAALYRQGGNLGEYLQHWLAQSENPAVLLCAGGRQLPAEMEQALAEELKLLSALSRLQPEALARAAAGADDHKLPLIANTQIEFESWYQQRLAAAPQLGYGMFATAHMFTVTAKGKLRAVRNPDPQRMDQLIGYELQRTRVQRNTIALLQGLPAANVLLYGDAGTGKSSTVKALANEYKSRGLRLVELRKNQLELLGRLLNTLAEIPLKFILYVDDLSFGDDEEGFTSLKSLLEGNAGALPQNVAVYATSNRRHLVGERFTQRQQGQVNAQDAVEQQASLAARFGLTVTFLRPDKEQYARLVTGLAKEYALATLPATLLPSAEAWAIRHGGRTPRAAKQFVLMQKSEEQLNTQQGDG